MKGKIDIKQGLEYQLYLLKISPFPILIPTRYITKNNHLFNPQYCNSFRTHFTSLVGFYSLLKTIIVAHM